MYEDFALFQKRGALLGTFEAGHKRKESKGEHLKIGLWINYLFYDDVLVTLINPNLVVSGFGGIGV